MSTSSQDFRVRAGQAISDLRLQAALDKVTHHFREGRQNAMANLPESDELRDLLKLIRGRTVDQLGAHLETFERNATAAGSQVHWAVDGQEAVELVVEIARQHKAVLAAKSKSMLTEEIHLNDGLQAAGIRAVETDLGEWILQLAGETPYHIIGPAAHKTKEQVASLIEKEAGRELASMEIPDLTQEARAILRENFLAADIGITGANIGVAETGSIVLVTNEGNGRLVSSLPPVHVVLIGIEKIAPGWQEAGVWLSLLARSATGQPLSAYTSVITGPARSGDPDGPQAVHIILVDNQRGNIAGTPYQEVLSCIRCGACLNVCPVYREAGGHAYGSPYSGPIGAVVSPLLFGAAGYAGLPQASTLCGACLDVCPARIDLPRMLLQHRMDQVQTQSNPRVERLLQRAAAGVLARPGLYRILTWIGRRLQVLLARRGRLPWRNLPALAKRSFAEQWQREEWE